MTKERVLDYMRKGGITRAVGCVYIMIDGQIYWRSADIVWGMQREWEKTDWTCVEQGKLQEFKGLKVKI
jgi:hypothetical protein